MFRQAIERAILARAARELRTRALAEPGNMSARGAAIWDAATAIDPYDGDMLKVGPDQTPGWRRFNRTMRRICFPS